MSHDRTEDPGWTTLEIADRVDRVCDGFEAAWKRGERPAIVEYLSDATGSERSVLLRELLAADLEWRRRRGEHPHPDDYLGRFPADAESIAVAFHEAETQEYPSPPPAGAGPLLPSASSPTAAGARFQILRPHARGGLGAVYVARDGELNREVALKEIRRSHAGDAGSRARFLREAEITGGLEHPGIVPVYGMGQHADGRPFYAMRFIRGESLKEAIARFHAADGPDRPATERALERRRLLRRLIDVCNAVAYAHSRGIVHRDLKPANIMLGPYGETLVVDWGLAKIIDPVNGTEEESGTAASPTAGGSTLTRSGTVLGTPAFMSPEQAEGRYEQVGPASDVYSLGATLYTILTGQAPFAGYCDEGRDRTTRAKFAPPRAIRPDVSRALEAACLKAMAASSADRYSSARALADDLERWLADEPVSALPERWSTGLARWMRRHRTWALAIASSLLIVTAVATAAAVLIDQARRAERRARHDTDQALTAERAARDESVRQGNRAEANARTARQAVDEYLTKVSQSTLLKQQNVHDLRELRKELLEAGLGYYRLLAAQQEGNPSLQTDLADAYDRVAQITAEIGSEGDALKADERAVSIREALVAERPDDVRRRHNLGLDLFRLGHAYVTINRPAEAMLHLKRSRDLLKRLSDERPDDPEVRADLAESLLRTGVARMAARNPVEAMHWFEQAREIRAGLVEDHPEVARYRRDLATALSNIGGVHGMTGQPARALEPLGEARDQAKWLLANDQASIANQDFLAKIGNNLGSAYRDLGHYPEALEAYQQALATQARLAGSHPTVTDFQAALARLHGNIGGVRREIGDPAGALRSFEQSREIRTRLVAAHSAVTEYQVGLAAVLTDLGALHRTRGDDTQALENLQEARRILERIPDLNARGLYNLAVAYVQLGGLSAPPEPPDAPVPWAERAVQALRRAVDAGLAQARHVSRDPDLAPLRSRGDFQNLLRDMAFPAEVFAQGTSVNPPADSVGSQSSRTQ
jgi:serine/threonine-protein kinase